MAHNVALYKFISCWISSINLYTVAICICLIKEVEHKLLPLVVDKQICQPMQHIHWSAQLHTATHCMSRAVSKWLRCMGIGAVGMRSLAAALCSLYRRMSTCITLPDQ